MISVTPGTFSKVEFEAGQIESAFNDVAEIVGGPPADVSVEIIVDEDEPTTRVAIGSLDPLVLLVDSGALEDTRIPQTFGSEMATNTFGRLLFEYHDRQTPGFGAPALGEPSDLAQRVAWDVYCYGRLSRLGVRVYRPKHVYNFRNRLGFSDAADAVFDRLWSGEGLTWPEIAAMCPDPEL